MEKRKDSHNRVLKDGEYQRFNGTYEFRWRTKNGKTKCVYARTLEDLRKKESEILEITVSGVRIDGQKLTVDDMYEKWVSLKRGIKPTTMACYQYLYELYAQPDLGEIKIFDLRRSDVRQFYNSMMDRGLKIGTIELVNIILHQILDVAVDDNYIKANPVDKAIRELHREASQEKRHRSPLTVDEQNRFMSFVKQSETYRRYFPIFTVMLETGLRVGEVTSLRWQDIDFKNRLIDINHTAARYNCRVSMQTINSPKTKSSQRSVPMTTAVYDAFKHELIRQKENGICSTFSLAGYTDFVFVQKSGKIFTQNFLNTLIHRIVRDFNSAEIALLKNNEITDDDFVLLPDFSTHTFRHTCATRLCEAGVNIKVIQSILGHASISTTMDIYTEATRDFKKEEMERFNEFLKIEK